MLGVGVKEEEMEIYGSDTVPNSLPIVQSLLGKTLGIV